MKTNLKKLLCGLVTAGMIMTQLSGLGLVFALEDSEIAQGKPVTECSDYIDINTNKTAQRINDGNLDTEWYSGIPNVGGYNDGWMEIDLEDLYEISKIEVYLKGDGYNFPLTYRLEAKQSDGSYEVIARDTVDLAAGIQAVKEYTSFSSGRFVRVFIENSGPFGAIVQEVKVYGSKSSQSAPVVWPDESEENPLERVNLALKKPASSSKNVQGYGASNAVDGNESTRWYDGDNQNAGNWLQVDLGAVVGLDEIEILWVSQTIPYKFEVQVSNDAQTWKHIYIGDNSAQQICSNFNVVGSGRYIRVHISKWGDWGTSIAELRVYGSEDHKAGNHIDAEDGKLIAGTKGNLTVNALKEACGGKYVDGFQGDAAGANNGAGVEFSPQNLFNDTRTYLLSLGYARYFYEKADTIGIYVNDIRVKSFNLVSETDNINNTIKSEPIEIELKAGDKVTVKVDEEQGDHGWLRLDYIELGLKINRPSRDITMVYPHIALDVGETANILVDYKQDNELEYFVEDTSIAVVRRGIVKAKANGTTRIMARVKSAPFIYAIGRVSVGTVPEGAVVPIRQVNIADETMAMINKETRSANVTVSPENAATHLLWETSNSNVATVSDGKIKAIKKGEVVITAKSALNHNIKDTVKVTIGENANIDIIKSSELEVVISKTFPTVYDYTLIKNGGVVQGNTQVSNKIKLNNIEYTPVVEYTKISDSQANYKLIIGEMNAAINMTLKVESNDFKLDVTSIVEDGADDKRIFTFDMPQNVFVSMTNKDAGASFAGSKVESSILKTGDVFYNLKHYENVDKNPDGGFVYAFLSNSSVSAGFRGNAMDSKILKQTTKLGDTYTTALYSGAWRYRASDYTKTFQDTEGAYGEKNKVITKTYKAPYTEQMPLIYISFADDLNNSGNVDWQDGAIAFRDIMPLAIGMDKIPDAVVQRLIFPQSGGGNYPYIASLDETKRVSLATDGLGQLILNKCHNEGNWGNLAAYDDALGGYKLFNEYVTQATQKYNSWVGVHNNFTEIYGKAADFRPEKIEMLADGITPLGAGYGGYAHWLQQVYVPDITFDALSLERQNDMKGFKQAVPDLGFIYSDVFSGFGWKGRRLAEDYKAADLAYFVEWPYQNEEESVWSHWAVEKPYSPPNLKAYASDIARFIFNHTKDRWDNNANCPDRMPNSCNLLMGTDTTTYEGWPQVNTNNGFDKSMQVVFDNNLPTKYMQHFPITRMDKDSLGWATHIWFEGGLEVFQDANNNNKRTMTKDGKVIYNQDSYLIPWDEGTIDNPSNEQKEVKLYHYNENGGTTSWELPNSWAGLKNVYAYELTDLGRINKVVLSVSNNRITIPDVKAKTAYVIYKGEADPIADVEYGKGDCVRDPGFNYGDLRAWTIDKGTPKVKKNDTEFDNTNTPGWGRNVPFGQQRNYELVIDGTDETQVSQVITGLKPGEYAATVMVEIQQQKQRKASVIVDNGVSSFINYADKSILMDFDEYDSKIGTYMLRMRVNFVVPEGSNSVTLKLNAQAGEGKVRFDNVRVYETEVPKPESSAVTGKVILFQDFEMADFAIQEHPLATKKPTYEGHYPFNLGAANGIHETRISIQKAHAPFTNNGTSKWDPTTVSLDDTLNGERALKVLGIHSKGIAIQTTPQTVRFEAGKTYRVSLKYQTQPADDYAFVIGDGKQSGLSSEERQNPNNIIYQETLTKTSTTKTYVHEFTATSNDNWFGIYRHTVSMGVFENPAPIVLDDILVQEIENVSGTVAVTYQSGAADATGTTPVQMAVTPGTTITLKQNTFSRNGYEFVGWSDGVTIYQPGSSYTVNEVTLFTASWIKQVTPISQGKPSSASKEMPEYSSDKAFDGIENNNSRWYDGYGDPENPQAGDKGTDNQWLAVDLEKAYNINKIDIVWEPGPFNTFAPRYELQVSNDGVNYTKIHDGTATSSEKQSITISATGRHVRLYILQPGWWGTSVRELKVYGSEDIIGDVNKTDLKSLIEYAKARQKEPEYTHVVSVVKTKLTEMITAGQTIVDKTDATQSEVDKAYNDLLAIVHMLSYTGDSTNLRLTLDIAKGKDLTLYTNETAKALSNAIAAAEKVVANDNALQDEIDAANAQLQKAINELVSSVDKKDLLNKINEAKLIDLSKFLDAGKTEFTDALTAAQGVYDNTNATQAEVELAYNTLRDAIYGLREIPDKSKLEELINSANAIDLSKYTNSSSEMLREALEKAVLVVKNNQATISDVDDATNLLSTAILNLELVSTEEPPSKDDVPTTSDSNLYFAFALLAMFGCCVVIKKFNKLLS